MVTFKKDKLCSSYKCFNRSLNASVPAISNKCRKSKIFIQVFKNDDFGKTRFFKENSTNIKVWSNLSINTDYIRLRMQKF